MNILNQSQIKSIIKIALQSGEIAMSYFGGNDLNIKKKSDDSPLTIADSLISELIYNGLKKIIPEIPIICEERENRDFGDGTFWLIDPIDGTISFANNDPEFTINIALIKNQKPVFGLIFAPAINDLPFYYTDENGILMRYFVGNKKSEFFTASKRDEKDLVIISSKRSSDTDIIDYLVSNPQFYYSNSLVCLANEGNDAEAKTDPELRLDHCIFLDKKLESLDGEVKSENCKAENDKLENEKGGLNNLEDRPEKLIRIKKVSSSFKFLYLIEGKADLYLHLRKSMEWDIAAGQALLEAAGGRIINLDGSEFKYQKVGLLNQPFFAAF